MKKTQSHQFSQVPNATIQRSKFDRSHGFKTTFNSGYLIPFFLDECLPGDTFNLRAHYFARLATPLTPFMDNLRLDTFFFAVPLRLLWENFQKFMGEQIDPEDPTDFLIPQIVSPVNGYANGSIYDYLGLPTSPLPDVTRTISHSALPLRAYNLIYNEWFRDQNLQDSLPVPKGDGPDLYTTYALQRRGKRHDYFTSCLPWPQKGPTVTLPLGTSAPVYGRELTYDAGQPVDANIWQSVNSSDVRGVGVVEITGSPGTLLGNYEPNQYGTKGLSLGTPDDYELHPTWSPPYADLTNATAATINSLREAFQLQAFYERDARGGTRYTEIIKSHFGVTSPDARLQRPEYLGGGSNSIQINPIAQTSSSTEDSPQGNLAAMGTSSGSAAGFTKSFVEHTIVIGMLSVRADLNYQQSLNRMWTRRTRPDFYWPSFANLGEQAVLQKEIYAGTDADDVVFGYQERYAEYRYKPSLITGQFRSNYAESLDIWHLAQDFGSAPTLDPNGTFIQENPPVERVLALEDESTYPQFLFDCDLNLKCARPMPLYSVPVQLGRF